MIGFGQRLNQPVPTFLVPPRVVQVQSKACVLPTQPFLVRSGIIGDEFRTATT